MEKWGKIYLQYKSLIVCSEVILLFILIGHFEGIIWIFAPIIFPILFVFMFAYLDKGVWQRHNLLLYCTLIPALFIGIIKFGNGSHDDIGTVLLEMAICATFLISFVTVASMKVYSIQNSDKHNPKYIVWKLLTIMFVAFTASFLLTTYLNYNL